MITLRQFVESVSDTAERVFRKTGGIDPIFQAIKRDGTPFHLPIDLDNKDLVCAVARAAFNIFDITRYVYVAEAWQYEALGADTDAKINEAIRVGLKNQPGRKEIVMFSAEDEAEGQLLAQRTIVRPATGRAYLGPLEIETRYNISEGRFVGLLPRKATVQ